MQDLQVKRQAKAADKTIRKNCNRAESADAVALALYLTTDFTLKQIAEQTGLNYSALNQLASKREWTRAKKSYRELSVTLGCKVIESNMFDRVQEIRSKQAKDLTRLIDKISAHISEITLPDSKEPIIHTKDNKIYVKTYEDALEQNAKILDKLSNSYRTAQKSLNSALGIADSIDISLDIAALAPQGKLDLTRVDIVPEWQGVDLEAKLTPGGEECQVLQGGISVNDLIQATQGVGVGGNYPPASPDRLAHSRTGEIFSNPDAICKADDSCLPGVDDNTLVYSGVLE